MPLPKTLTQVWLLVAVFIIAGSFGFVAAMTNTPIRENTAFKPTTRVHLDHGPFYPQEISDPRAVTRSCLTCHEDAASQMMTTSHFEWLGEKTQLPGRAEPVRMGKKNLINNFCISTLGNWKTCTRCHAGYGFGSDDFDANDQENVDCLVCHDWSGSYVKGGWGLPKEGVDLAAAARSVGYPKRNNCGVCHYFGGGGLGVKHGDLDNSLNNPSEELDVHMGKHGLLCVDCHRAPDHRISGRSYAVGTDSKGGIGCTDCHPDEPHNDHRLNTHTTAVACQTCHIPLYAKRVPTKMKWDWSKAGDDTREEEAHEYMKIKGEFVYEEGVVPEYRWFDLTTQRYLMGDKMDPSVVTPLNSPNGELGDGKAKIWPFKVHLATQPYDKEFNYLIPPVTAGEGGYWTTFDWPTALADGARTAGLQFSGAYDFAPTEMYWALSHMVAPKSQALTCTQCHGSPSLMDWRALGYSGDPMHTGGRR